MWKQGLYPIRVLTDPIAEILMRIFNGPYFVELRPYLNSTLPEDREASDNHIEYFEGAVEVFKEQFALRTLEYGSMLVILLGSIWVVRTCGLVSIPLQIVGISIDILGALILARGLLSGPIIIAHQSGGGFGDANSELRDSMIQDAIDGTWGILLLLSGFMLQAVAVF